MFAQIIDFLKSIWSAFLPWTVVDQWQQSVVLRFGRFLRILGPGFHWIIPFADVPMPYSVVTTTTVLRPQSIVTRDGRVITAEAVVRWSIDDVKAFAVDIWDGQNVIVDSTQGAIADALRSLDFDSPDLRRKVLDESRKALKRFGIKVEAVTFTTLAPVRVIRLIGCANVQENQTSV